MSKRQARIGGKLGGLLGGVVKLRGGETYSVLGIVAVIVDCGVVEGDERLLGRGARCQLIRSLVVSL